MANDGISNRPNRSPHAIGVVAMALLTFVCVLPLLQRPSDSGDRPFGSRHDLKNIGFAMNSYRTRHSAFPSGRVVVDGVAKHGWNTLLLPYIDESAIYRQVDLDEAWDSPRNREACTMWVRYYANSEEPNQAPINGYPITHFAGNVRLLAYEKVVNFKTMEDGQSNVILAGDAGNGAGPWAAPDNLRDPSDGLGHKHNKFGRSSSLSPAGAYFVMADGAVRFFGLETDLKVLKKLAEPE